MTRRVRVLSYNIHKGFDLGNRRFVLRQMKEAIRSVDADVVFLQEVLGEHEVHAGEIPEWPDQSQFEFLADEVWPHYAYGQNAVYDAGHHGNAILSRFPIRSWSNVDVSTNQFEQRGILHASIELPEDARRIHCLCLHFNMLRTGQLMQVGRLCDRVAELVPADEALLIAGDFNDWSELASGMLGVQHEILDLYRAHHGRTARTFPAWFPVLKLDRIYGRRVRVVEARRLSGQPWRSLSDHVPLFAVVEV